jgi:nicotinate-nucleotide--dimethylbenzimidazole phosphoribosyltransferase
MQTLEQITAEIQAPDTSIAQEAQDRIDFLTKPPGSLGRMEELARTLCLMKGTLEIKAPKPAVAVFAADHGVAADGVSLFPREVTVQMVYNFLAGGAGINVFSRQIGATVKVVDVGVDADFENAPELVSAKVARGTANLFKTSAMTEEQARQAIQVGAMVAKDLIDSGHDLLIPGDMGIGNTTPSTAIACAFTGKTPAEITGRGTGIDDKALAGKTAGLQKALDLHKPDPANPLKALADLGGLEIAAICGYCLYAASQRVPVVLDGIISTAGGISAAMLCPDVKHYFFAGHRSVEGAQSAMLEVMGLEPILDLKLRLGEGTGAALAAAMIISAVAMYNEMATFESAGVTN